MTIADVTGCRVLVVEDETMIAVLIEDILGAMECKIGDRASTRARRGV
jgi:hypothetical protein